MNPFDNRYIKTDSDMHEGAKNEIVLQQPEIPHESYLSAYITALDLCLQGLISPSTLGIDVKKLDNADAQREKEKATLYSRNAIVGALQEDLQSLIKVSIKAYRELNGQSSNDDVEVDVTFGEYANPSFESQVETVGKGRSEVARLKAEQGIMEVEDPAVNTAAGDFQIGESNGSNNNEPLVQNEPTGDEKVPKTDE